MTFSKPYMVFSTCTSIVTWKKVWYELCITGCLLLPWWLSNHWWMVMDIVAHNGLRDWSLSNHWWMVIDIVAQNGLRDWSLSNHCATIIDIGIHNGLRDWSLSNHCTTIMDIGIRNVDNGSGTTKSFAFEEEIDPQWCPKIKRMKINSFISEHYIPSMW